MLEWPAYAASQRDGSPFGAYLRRDARLHIGMSTSQPRRRRCPPPRAVHVAAAASPRLAVTGCLRRDRGVAAARLYGLSTSQSRRAASHHHGLSTSQPRRRRDSPSRAVYVAAAASPRLAFTGCLRRSRGGAAARFDSHPGRLAVCLLRPRARRSPRRSRPRATPERAVRRDPCPPFLRVRYALRRPRGSALECCGASQYEISGLQAARCAAPGVRESFLRRCSRRRKRVANRETKRCLKALMYSPQAARALEQDVEHSSQRAYEARVRVLARSLCHRASARAGNAETASSLGETTHSASSTR